MGCCAGTKSSEPPLKPLPQQKVDKPKQEQPFTKIEPSKSAIRQSNHTPVVPKQIQPSIKVIEEQEHSDRPGWKESEFINYPETAPNHIQNSPIQIIYSSDPNEHPPGLSTIKRKLFKPQSLDQSIIQEVSQENADSLLLSQQASKEIYTLHKRNGQLEYPIQQDQINVDAVENPEALCEQQVLLNFQFKLPKLSIQPSLPHS